MENPTPQEQVTETCTYGSNHIDREHYNTQVDWRAKLVDASNRDKVLEGIKSVVRDGILDKDTALTVFNTIADRAGWDTEDKIQCTYTVTVTAFGQEIGEFTGVEAYDEDEACELVQSNYDITSADLSLSVDYAGDCVEDSIDLTSGWSIDLNDYIEFEANEE